jgi:hypothetical protein
MDSSPGYPLSDLANTNAELVSKHGDLLFNLVLDRINKLCELEEYNQSDLRDYILNGYTDPIRIFIKVEPHKRKKILLRRYRIISSVSVIDQVVDRVLFGDQCNSETFNWPKTPSKSGTGLSTDEQQRMLYVVLKKLCDKLVTSDVSGWDWNFKEWQYWAEYIRTLMVWGYDFDTAYDYAYSPNFKTMPKVLKVAWYRTKFLSYNYFGLSNGELLTHGPPGIQKSGSLKTLSTNSAQRALLAMLIFDEDANTMGDDAIEAWHREQFKDTEFISAYLEWGFILTDVKLVVNDEPLDFCSHQIYEDRAVPVNQIKMVFKYLHSDLMDTEEQKYQISTDLRYAPDGDFILGYLRSRWQAWAIQSTENTENNNNIEWVEET